MRLGEVFERFLQQAPISVMFRALLEHALDPAEIDRLFEETATSQYTRELLFSSIVDLMGARRLRRPALGPRRLPGLARRDRRLADGRLREAPGHRARRLPRPSSGTTAGRLAPLVRQLDATLPQPVPGYRAKILDGNHLAGTEHRLKADADDPRRGPAGPGPGGPRPGHHAGHRRRPVRGRPRPGAVPARPGPARGRARRPVDRRPQLLHDAAPLRHPRPRRLLPGPAAPVDAPLGGGHAVGRRGPGRHRDRVRADDPVTEADGERGDEPAAHPAGPGPADPGQGDGTVPADEPAARSAPTPCCWPRPTGGAGRWRTCSRA